MLAAAAPAIGQINQVALAMVEVELVEMEVKAEQEDLEQQILVQVVEDHTLLAEAQVLKAEPEAQEFLL
jgi:hypothetical protein